MYRPPAHRHSLDRTESSPTSQRRKPSYYANPSSRPQPRPTSPTSKDTSTPHRSNAQILLYRRSRKQYAEPLRIKPQASTESPTASYTRLWTSSYQASASSSMHASSKDTAPHTLKTPSPWCYENQGRTTTHSQRHIDQSPSSAHSARRWKL